MSQNTDFIPYARPRFGPEEEEAVLRVLRNGWLTTGSECRAFEDEFAAFVQMPYAITVSSATAGLHLALLGMNIQKGDRVAVPTYTFTATAEVILYLGAEPVLIDCAPDTFMMDVSILDDLILHKPNFLRAIIPVHFGGQACYPDFWSSARDRGVKVIEDCAHAFPVTTDHGYLGDLGDIGVYSFYANKTITTGEGGMVVTRNPQVAQRIKTLRLHGIDRDAFQRFQSTQPAWFYDIVDAGYKYNLTDIQAAIGRAQLRKAHTLKQQRQEVARFYQSHRESFPGWIFPDHAGDCSWHLFPALCPRAEDRDRIIQKLYDLGVGTSVHYIPLHRHTFWRTRYNLKPEQFPVAESLWQRELSLPIGPGIGLPEAEKVVDRLHKVHREIYG